MQMNRSSYTTLFFARFAYLSQLVVIRYFLFMVLCQYYENFVLWNFMQLRQEALESLNGIIEEAHKRIQPTGTGIV